MQPRYAFIAVFLIAILVVFVHLKNTDPGIPRTGPTTVEPSHTPDAQAESIEAQAEMNAIISATTGAAESQVTPQQDGPELLQDHCAQCHAVHLLEQSKKSRTDWEKTLSRMEKNGVRLTDTEKYILLDHLAAP
jgi:cytochrome c5